MQDMNFYVTSQPADMNLGQWSRTTSQVVVRTKFALQGLLDKRKNYYFAKLWGSFAAPTMLQGHKGIARKKQAIIWML